MYVGLHVKYLLFLSDFTEILLFSSYFRKKLEYQILLKSVQWEPNCSMRADGGTDRQIWRIFAFHNFANIPKNFNTDHKYVTWILASLYDDI